MNINTYQWIHWVIHCLILQHLHKWTILLRFDTTMCLHTSKDWGKLSVESYQPSTETFFFFTHMQKPRTQNTVKDTQYDGSNTLVFFKWICNCKTFLVYSSQIFDIWNNEIIYLYTFLVCTVLFSCHSVWT